MKVAAHLARLLVPLLLLAAGIATPADRYGPLYRAVELGRIFPDSKTFADAVPRRATAAILADYRTRRPTGAALRAFVVANFILPGAPRPPRRAPATPLLAHIAATWGALTRPPVASRRGGSALPVPRRFVVPGGRFRELYY